MTPLFAAIGLFAFVFIFGLILICVPPLLARLGVSQKAVYDPVKQETYECGLPEQLTGHSKVSVKFYLTAILFILFDIEIIFMYPWALALGDFVNAGQGLYMLGVMGFFIAVFVFGLFWEIKSKALDWE